MSKAHHVQRALVSLPIVYTRVLNYVMRTDYCHCTALHTSSAQLVMIICKVVVQKMS